MVIGTLVDHACHLARLFVELAVCAQQVHKRRLAAVLRAARAVQPLKKHAEDVLSACFFTSVLIAVSAYSISACRRFDLNPSSRGQSGPAQKLSQSSSLPPALAGAALGVAGLGAAIAALPVLGAARLAGLLPLPLALLPRLLRAGAL